MSKRFVIDRSQVNKLLEKYPSQEKLILKTVEEVGKIFNQSAKQYEWYKGKWFLEEIKDWIYFVDRQRPKSDEEIIDMLSKRYPEQIEDSIEDFKIIWGSEWKDYQIPEEEYLVENLIPNKSLGFLSGKRFTYKTFFCQYLCYCLATGKDFLGFKCNQLDKILYLNLENPEFVMKKRELMIQKGLGIEKNQDIISKVGVITANLKIDRQGDYEKLKKMIEKHNFNLIIVDSFRRFTDFRENKSDDINEFYNLVKPLIRTYNLSIILIHHDTKGNQKDYDSLDKMRGSGDLPAQADFVLNLREDKQKNLILRQLKIRTKPLSDKQIQIDKETDENTYFRFKSEEYNPHNAEKQAKEVILKWLVEKKVNYQFKTKELKEFVMKQGVSVTSFESIFPNYLLSEFYIERIKKGNYKVLKKINEQFTL